MSDNTLLSTGSGGNTVRDIDRGGVHTQVVVFDIGGTSSELILSSATPMPTNVLGTAAVAVQGTAAVSNVPLTNLGAGQYKTVASTSTVALTGTGTGAIGDYLAGALITPATVNAGAVTVVDGTSSYTIFTGGSTSVSNLVPFIVPIGSTSTNGPWKIVTSTSVSVWASGKFT